MCALLSGALAGASPLRVIVCPGSHRRRNGPNSIAPTPADHIAAVRAAAPLVSVAERGDPVAFAAVLAEAVSDPHSAGQVVYGLVRIAQFALALPSFPPGSPARLEVLDLAALDLAALDLAALDLAALDSEDPQ